MRIEHILTLALLPILLAGAHGWFTNWIAIRLLLKPVRPVNILGFRLQGLLPRRQAELADRISEAIAREFLTEKDILAFLSLMDPAQAMRDLLNRKWDEKVGEFLESIPFAKAFVSPQILHSVRDKIGDALASESGSLSAELVRSLQGRIDLRETIRRNILSFQVERLNGIIEEIGKKEFGEIAWIGAALGVAIGLVQATVNWLYLR